MTVNLEEWHLDDYLRIFGIHRVFIFTTTFLLGVLAAVQMVQSPNIYRATTRIIIETQHAQVVQFQEVTSAIDPWDLSFLRTEYSVISSRAVLSRSLEELHLASFPPFSNSRDPVLVLQSVVSVQPVRGTKLVDIRATSTKPELAARMADTVAETYAKLNLERRRELTTGGAQWLREEVVKMEKRMRESQLRLQEFREQHGTMDLGEENQGTMLQKIQALNATLNKTREERIDAETKYREKHPALQELMTKEKELQLALFEQEQKALEMSRLSIQYNALLRESKTSEQIYNILLTRLKELSVQEGLQANNVQIVDHALIPRRPIGPPRAKRVGLAVFLGLLFGCGVSMLREITTKTVRTRQDFEHLLEIPFLGHIPILAGLRARDGGNPLALIKDLKSPAAEAFRSIRTTLEFILPSGEPHLVLVSSSLPEEGKSTLCANLAIALRELGRKVLLVDSDLRRPVLHRIFGLNLEPGLSGFLQETATEEDILQTPPADPGISVIAAGMTPAQQPTDLLGSSRFRDLLKNCKPHYDYILIDSPPVLVASDAAVLATLADGILYLIRANRTHSEAALAGKQRLVDVGGKLIGGVLNGARLELEPGYRYYYSYRYYRGEPKLRWRSGNHSSAKSRRKSPADVPKESLLDDDPPFSNLPSA